MSIKINGNKAKIIDSELIDLQNFLFSIDGLSSENVEITGFQVVKLFNNKKEAEKERKKSNIDIKIEGIKLDENDKKDLTMFFKNIVLSKENVVKVN